jgi:hypothetical protein
MVQLVDLHDRWPGTGLGRNTRLLERQSTRSGVCLFSVLRDLQCGG